ncbi:MAG: YqgE/AlgH family protein [Salinisphaera sp.]|nr:YqgE/AlgH family protein [Salinisphaera sp.]MDN5937907.1 YqgE/AlgH family protein [Salinisphaera sp.]
MNIHSLGNQFLVAMPGLGGGAFDRTVTFLCEHGDEGAMGLVINRPTDLDLRDMLGHMGIEHESLTNPITVYWGGPVQPERGFVLHWPSGSWESTLTINNQLSITTSKDILEAIGRGEGPECYLVMLGYAGWGGGQLEAEMRGNAWLNTPVDTGIVFATPTMERWGAATRLLGVDPSKLTGHAGHA